MAGDLKTLKCMFSVSKGANLKSPCLYCMDGAKVFNRRHWKKALDRHMRDPNFQPVLDIPLSRVHICTMHALCRIIEKLLFLYICFSWTLQSSATKLKSIKALENVLSYIGLHVDIQRLNKMKKGLKMVRMYLRNLPLGVLKMVGMYLRSLPLGVLQQEGFYLCQNKGITLVVEEHDQWKP